MTLAISYLPKSLVAPFRKFMTALLIVTYLNSIIASGGVERLFIVVERYGIRLLFAIVKIHFYTRALCLITIVTKCIVIVWMPSKVVVLAFRLEPNKTDTRRDTCGTRPAERTLDGCLSSPSYNLQVHNIANLH